MSKLVDSLNPDSPVMIHAAADAAYEAGRFREAEGLYRRAIADAESSASASHLHVAKMAVSLVDLYENQGRYDEARLLSERVVGQIDPAEAAAASDRTLRRLTDLCRRAGQPHKSAVLYREAINYRRWVFGNVHGKVAACIAGMAETYRDLGNIAKARSLLLRAISMAEEAQDESIPALKQRLHELRQTVLAVA